MRERDHDVRQRRPGRSTAAPLPAGVAFWRVYTMEGTVASPVPSAVWQFRVRARSADGGIDNSFGAELDLNGDGYSDVAISASNTVYVYFGSPSGLGATPQTLPIASTSAATTVAAIGDVNGDGFPDLGVGAPLAQSMRGAVYVYFGSASGAVATPAEIIGPVAGGRLGGSLTAAGDFNGDGLADAAIGSEDRAYVYYGDAAGPSLSDAFNPPGNPSLESEFGFTACAGDFNNDRLGDVLVGAPGGPNEVAYRYFGGPTPVPQRLSEPTGTRGRFGESIGGGGDVNGDGFADVMVAAANTNAGADGVVHLYLGSASGLPPTPVPIRGRAATTEIFGWVIANQGDVDADGFDDLVVGTGFGDGAVYVFRGLASGVASSPMRLDGTTGADSHFGFAIASSGDIDGDGFADLIIGAPYLDARAGGAFLHRGTSTGVSMVRQVILRPTGASGFGSSIAN
ncbi:MAG: FG-GAP-like repeat-containing protein [Sandaracinaceae bacterium]